MNLLTIASRCGTDVEVGSLARSLVDMYSWSAPKLKSDQIRDGANVIEEDELIVVELWSAAMGQFAFADTRWVRFFSLKTRQLGWLPNQWVDKLA